MAFPLELRCIWLCAVQGGAPQSKGLPAGFPAPCSAALLLAQPCPVKCVNCSVSREGRSPPSGITSQQRSGFAISGVSWRAPSLWQGLPELRSAPRPVLSCAGGGRARLLRLPHSFPTAAVYTLSAEASCLAWVLGHH